MELERSESVLAEARYALARMVETILAEAGITHAEVPETVVEEPLTPEVTTPALNGHVETHTNEIPPTSEAVYEVIQIAKDDRCELGEVVPKLEKPPINRLSSQVRRCAELASQSLTNKQIAAQLGIKPNTVRAHLDKAYKDLGVHSRHQLAALIANDGFDLDNIDFSVLTIQEGAVFHGIVNGQSNGEVAYDLGVSSSTIRTHHLSIRKKLGISNGVELNRLAGAIYQSKLDAAQVVQGTTVAALKQIELKQQPGVLQVSKNAAKRLKDESALQSLYEEDYITYKMRQSGVVGLLGLVAALLMRRQETKHYLSNQYTAETARDILELEVELFLQAHEEQAV